jgi:hypothetical protein
VRTAEAGAASRRAAPSQSLEVQAASCARYVCVVHSRSPTVRRRTEPQHTTWHPSCATDPAAGGEYIVTLELICRSEAHPPGASSQTDTNSTYDFTPVRLSHRPSAHSWRKSGLYAVQ